MKKPGQLGRTFEGVPPSGERQYKKHPLEGLTLTTPQTQKKF